jgi:hypothetical protein
MVKVVGEFGINSAVDGEIVKGVPAAGSGALEELTAPLPHEFRNNMQQIENNITAPRAINQFIFTKIPSGVKASQ